MCIVGFNLVDNDMVCTMYPTCCKHELSLVPFGHVRMKGLVYLWYNSGYVKHHSDAISW